MSAVERRFPQVSNRVLLARLDSMGDVLLTGGAVRAVAARGAEVTLLVSPGQAETARLLPGVSEVIEFEAPWVVLEPPPVDAKAVRRLVRRVKRGRFDAALVFTSFHQSPLPLALLLRLAGVGWTGAISEDYPGSLLDLRHAVPDDLHEAERNLALVEAAGFPADGRGAELAVRRPLPELGPDTGAEVGARLGSEPYVVFHPGASVGARRLTPEHARDLVVALDAAGHRVAVTGSPGESTLTSFVAAEHALDLGGRLDLTGLAGVLDRADCVIVPNTGPAHLAAAVGTPVVSLFAPVVPAARWLPYGVPVRVLGDQQAACSGTRARTCPVAGHPCLSSITPADVVSAVTELSGAALPIPERRLT